MEAKTVDIDSIKIYFSKFFNSKKLAITRNEIDPMKEKK